MSLEELTMYMKMMMALTLAFCICASILAGCGESTAEEPTLSPVENALAPETVTPTETAQPSMSEDHVEYILIGIVTSVSGHEIMFNVTESETLASGEAVSASFPDDIEITATEGDTVTVWFDGAAFGSDPVKISASRYEITAKAEPSEELSGEPSEETEEETITAPSEEAIHALVDDLAFWSVNLYSETVVEAGPINVTTNQAAELAAGAYFWACGGYYSFEYDDTNYYGYYISTQGITNYLKNMFGSGYQLSDFTNTILEYPGYTNPVSKDHSYPTSPFALIGDSMTYISAEFLNIHLFKNDNQFYYDINATEGSLLPEDVIVTDIEKSEAAESHYNVNVRYDYSYAAYDENGPLNERGHASRDVEYELISSDDSDYGWIITQITYKEFNDGM